LVLAMPSSLNSLHVGLAHPPKSCDLVSWYRIDNVQWSGYPRLVQHVGQYADDGGHWWLKDSGIEASGDEWLVAIERLRNAIHIGCVWIAQRGRLVVLNQAAFVAFAADADAKIAHWRRSWQSHSHAPLESTP
jgi:hypothetical protein